MSWPTPVLVTWALSASDPATPVPTSRTWMPWSLLWSLLPLIDQVWATGTTNRPCSLSASLTVKAPSAVIPPPNVSVLAAVVLRVKLGMRVPVLPKVRLPMACEVSSVNPLVVVLLMMRWSASTAT